VYRLAFVHGEQALPFHVIGADGGLLERPHAARELFLSPSERADVVLDLRAANPGDRVVLASLAFDAMALATSARSGATDTATAVGAPLELMLLRVVRKVRYEHELPAVLSNIPPLQTNEARPRLFTLDQSKGVWRINRGTYRMTETAFSVNRGAKEIWAFTNSGPAMPHPIHVHGFQYRVVERKGSPEHVRRLAVDERGLPPTELGWKDTVLLWPGETLRMLIDFTHPYPGDQVYMLQCHNLEHEAHGMMVNFRVVA
jgi:suppressor of ftsI/bilirubin oxidase